MGHVYRARDTRLGRDVALKLVGESLVGDVAILARFEQEARLAGSLNHPNVLVVFDVGRHEGAPYLVTELLQGETLRERLTKGAVPLETALDWAMQIASGLAAAHAKGIVHRDLKPENVFIARSGHVKLLDFGIAKLAAGARGPSSHDLLESTVTPTGGMTHTGAVVGTPRYMSPEQVRGEAVDARTDLFSFGAVLYEMLAGRRAFPGDSAVDAGHAILHDEPSPLPPEVPLPVAQLVRHCLEKDPEKRFQSARDLAFNLDVLHGPTGSMPAGRVQRNRWRRWWWLVVPVAAAGLLGAVLYAGLFVRQERLPSIRQLTFRRGSVTSARFAPDGRTVYFSASWNGEPSRVYSTTTRSPDYHPLGINDAALEAVSSTGELGLILHRRNRLNFGPGTLARVPGVGGVPRKVAEDVSGADWAPDSDELVAVREAGGKMWLEFPLGHIVYESLNTLSLPRVSPRGDRVALVELNPSDGFYDVVVTDRSGHRRVLVEKWEFMTGLAWAPGGDELWLSGLPSFGAESLWAVSLAGKQRLLYRGTGQLWLDDVAADGRALVREVEFRIEVAILSTGNQAGNEHLNWFDGSWAAGLSADGGSVLLSEGGRAASRFSETSGARPGWALLQRTDGSPPIRLGEGGAMALSPNGESALVVDSNQPGRIWLLPTSSGTRRSIDFPGLDLVGFPSHFLADGKRVVFLAREGEGLRAYVADLESGKARVVTPLLECCGLEVSPDGRFLAATPRDGGVTAYPVDEGSPRPFKGLGPDDFPVGWSNRGLLVSPLGAPPTPRQPPVPIFRVDAETGARQLLTTLSPKGAAGITLIVGALVTPDEETVAYTYWISSSTLYVFDFRPDLREPARPR
jgi:eukaryotic-like serine/threonine-protein kinase